MWNINTVEYYSALKRKETDTSYNSDELEDIMLSEISPSQEDKYCTVPLIWGTWNSQSHSHIK